MSNANFFKKGVYAVFICLLLIILPVYIYAAIPVGTSPYSATLSGTYLYVTNEGSANVTVVDTATDTVVATTTITGNPVSATLVGTTLYVNDQGQEVSIINTNTNALITNLTLTGTGPNSSVLSGTDLYINNSTSQSVSVVSTVSNTETAYIDFNIGSSPISSTLVGTKIYVNNNGDGTVSVINTLTNSVDSIITVGTNPRFSKLVGTKLYVLNQTPGTVSVIDTNTDTVTATIAVGSNAYHATLVGTKLYVANIWSANVSIIDTATDAVVATTTVGTNPNSSILYGTDLFVLNQSSDTVSVINTNTNLVTDTITVGTTPLFGILVGTKIYIVNNTSADLTVIDAVTKAIYVSSSAPTVTTSAASSLTQTTATANGNVTSIGSASVTQHGFAYGTSATLLTTIGTTTLGTKSGTGAFTDSLSGLSANTTYYVRGYATNSVGTGYGAIQSFTTSAIVVPTVTTEAVSSIERTTATGNGTITATGGATPTARGVVYGATTAYGATTTEAGSFSTGAFTGAISSLTCNTSYHANSFATNSAGEGYGSDVTFTTSACASGGPASPVGNGAPGGGVGGAYIPPRYQIVYPDGQVVYLDPPQPQVVAPPVAVVLPVVVSVPKPAPTPSKPVINPPAPTVTSEKIPEPETPESKPEIVYSTPEPLVVDNAPQVPEVSPSASEIAPPGNFLDSFIEIFKKGGEKIDGISQVAAVAMSVGIVDYVGLMTGAFLVLMNAFALPLSGSELGLLPSRLFTLVLFAFGIKKKNRPWGVVYDSVTKQPIDPAYVVLNDSSGNEVASSITDLNGRYGFLVHPGTYTIDAHKTHYTFPSKKLEGKSGDVLYNDLYFGGEIVIVREGEVVAKNIPLDQEAFDWNEFQKGKQNLMGLYSRWDVWIQRVASVLFKLGFVASLFALFTFPEPQNFIILGLYLVISLLRYIGIKPKSFGTVTDENGVPLSYGLIKVFFDGSPDTIITRPLDQYGRYYILVPPGNYQVTIEKKNADESYTPVFSSPTFHSPKGIINTDYMV